MVDAVTQTDPIPGLETLEQLKTKNGIEIQHNLNTEQTVTENSQTAPPSNETQKQEKILKYATIEMIKKDLKKQTQAKLKSNHLKNNKRTSHRTEIGKDQETKLNITTGLVTE